MRKVLEEKDFTTKLWKNGKGITQEILVSPSDREDFDWRISLATLGESGSFSSFPGVLRWLVLLEGNPVTLKHTDRTHELVRMTPYSFSGGEETSAVVSGPGRDLNLMLREGRARGKISVGVPGRIKVTTKHFGLFSTDSIRVDGVDMEKNSFYYIEDEPGRELSVDSPSSFLILHIQGPL